MPSPADSASGPTGQPVAGSAPNVFRWIKTECGRAKFTELATRPGVLARLRLACFVLIAALRDWRLTDRDQAGGSPP